MVACLDTNHCFLKKTIIYSAFNETTFGRFLFFGIFAPFILAEVFLLKI